MVVIVRGKKITPDPRRSIGKGGEADVFDIGGGKALKLYKQPGHPDYEGLPIEQEAARLRIIDHQKKLPAFPKGLPTWVIAPEDLALDRSDRIVGYTAPYVQGVEVLLRYAEKSFRQGGINPNTVVQIFREMHSTVTGIHARNVVIGDFNDLNILVQGEHAYFIDADSFQFDKFLCRVFTAKFVDPLLCDPKHQSGLMLAKPHTADSDWYAYGVMLMQCLLYVGPYGGVFRPKKPVDRILHDARPLKRVTIFHPEVVYPKPALPMDRLPDDLLQYFERIFAKDTRGVFPLRILESLRWTACTKCGTEHARKVCPECSHGVPTVVITVRGAVVATQTFKTGGVILFAALQQGVLKLLYHEGGEFKREDKRTVLRGDLDPHVRYRLQGDKTILGKEKSLAVVTSDGNVTSLNVDSMGLLPLFDANEHHLHWVDNGRLLYDGQLGPEYIGDVLPNQTLFWVGEQFGFGFYRAGEMSVAFVFEAGRRGLNDSVALPKIRGQLIDSTCVFAKDRCWFFASTRERGQTVNRCMVIRQNGAIEAVAEAPDGDGTWLGTIRGKCASGNFLLSATDDGIVRVESNGGQIAETKQFPDTEPFVDANCHLFPSKSGITVVSRTEVRLLKMS